MRIASLTSFLVFASSMTFLIGCGEEKGSGGATASLLWDPQEHSEVRYTVHYGKHSSRELGSCDYEHSVDVSEPTITLRDLEFSTRYYFAVSAYYINNGVRSLCSDEVSKLAS